MVFNLPSIEKAMNTNRDKKDPQTYAKSAIQTLGF
jgi:hypothetical protein